MLCKNNCSALQQGNYYLRQCRRAVPDSSSVMACSSGYRTFTAAVISFHSLVLRPSMVSQYESSTVMNAQTYQCLDILHNFERIHVHVPLDLEKLSSGLCASLVMADNCSGLRAQLRKSSHFSFSIANAELKRVPKSNARQSRTTVTPLL